MPAATPKWAWGDVQDPGQVASFAKSSNPFVAVISPILTLTRPPAIAHKPNSTSFIIRMLHPMINVFL